MYATAQTHFIFNNDFYDPIDGVALGSPLAPTLANLFMRFDEEKWINEYSGPGLMLYRRYVDDIFAVFNSENEAAQFFE